VRRFLANKPLISGRNLFVPKVQYDRSLTQRHQNGLTL
jgi:hypothetical protein